MLQQSFLLSSLSLAIALTTGLFSHLPVAASRPPSPSTPPSGSSLVAQRLNFLVRDVRASRQRVGGFSRGGQCVPNNAFPTMMPVIPRLNPSNNEIDVELSAAEQPLFLSYVPQTTATGASFLLMNETREVVIYETEISLTGQAGVIGVALPATVNLEPDKVYYWSLSLVCDSGDASSPVMVEGYVQRQPLSPALFAQVQRSSLRDRPPLYASQGIWQDTVSTLARLRFANPDDPALRGDWIRLLNSVNLAAIATAPIIQLAGVTPEPVSPAIAPSPVPSSTLTPSPRPTTRQRTPLPPRPTVTRPSLRR